MGNRGSCVKELSELCKFLAIRAPNDPPNDLYFQEPLAWENDEWRPVRKTRYVSNVGQQPRKGHCNQLVQKSSSRRATKLVLK